MCRSDRRGKYTSNYFFLFCQEHEIIHEVTVSYSPQSNSVAEHKNHTLLDMVNAMLISSDLSKNLWGKAFLSSCFILNRISVKDSAKTPYEF